MTVNIPHHHHEDFLKSRSKIIDGVLEITPETIDELIKIVRLDDIDMGWVPKEQYDSTWVFRGHRQWNWQLKAPTRREEKELIEWKEIIQKFRSRHLNPPSEHLKKQLFGTYIKYNQENLKIFYAHEAAENDLIYNFIILADEIGLAIPGGVPKKDKIKSIHMALAQHAQVPTQMLDWTGSPLAALFIALEKVEENQEQDAALWALNMQI